MLIEYNPNLATLHEDAFKDVADRICDVLDREFNKRKEVPPAFFNGGFSYVDYLTKIVAGKEYVQELPEEDDKLAHKIVAGEFKKLSKAEMFTMRMHSVEGGIPFHGSSSAAQYAVVHHWRLRMVYAYMDNHELQDMD